MSKGTWIKATDFCKIWQGSKTLTEAAEKTGMRHSHCGSRASYYRRKGVQLKRMPKLNVDRINRLIGQ